MFKTFSSILEGRSSRVALIQLDLKGFSVLTAGWRCICSHKCKARCMSSRGKVGLYLYDLFAVFFLIVFVVLDTLGRGWLTYALSIGQNWLNTSIF